jgi:serine-type D-Ala-D-Ala carboxypeptidase (penicillin-binding protein 5/6)
MRRLALPIALALSVLAAAPCMAATPSLGRAKSAIVIDGHDGHVLLQKDPDEHRAMASTTKLMTALLTLERTKPSEVFTAPAYDAGPAESKIDLRKGERMKVADLLQALLLESANDAAVTLADGISRSPSAFVSLMNRRAAQLGLSETSYANPVGLDDPDNYSSARDLAKLAVLLMRRPQFARIVDQKQAVLRSGSHRRVVENRNVLVGRYPFVDGVKTGHTIDAGFVLVGAADERGPRVISVVMGEPSEDARDSDSLALLRWGLSRFHTVRALSPRRPVTSAKVRYRDERVSLVPRHSLSVTVRRGERLGRRIDAPDELDGPLSAGKRVGTVAVVHGREVVRREPLVTARAVPGAGVLRVVTSVLGVPLTLLIVLGILMGGALATLRLRVRLRLVRGGADRTPTGAP